MKKFYLLAALLLASTAAHAASRRPRIATSCPACRYQRRASPAPICLKVSNPVAMTTRPPRALISRRKKPPRMLTRRPRPSRRLPRPAAPHQRQRRL